jgi:hypothetical protein
MSHHLTTFVYIITVISITFFSGFRAKEIPTSFKTDIIYIIFLTGLTFGYWALIATPVFYSFMPGGLYLSPFGLVVLFYIILGLVVGLLHLKYRFGYNHKPKLLTTRSENILMVMVIVIFIVVVGLLSYNDLGTGFKFLPSAFILLLPTIIVYSFAIIALNRIDFEPYGPKIKGIFYSIFGVFLFSVITWNQVLLPYRFLEYLSYPICILSALGFLAIIELKKGITWEQFSFTKKSKWIFAIFTTAVIISGATTYAVQEATGGYEESISSQVRDAVDYLEFNTTVNGTVASDHRISSVLWERGFNATYDYAYNLWFDPNWNSTTCLNELHGHGVGKEYGKVDYVVIDSVMVRKGVQSNINETPRPITAIGYEKFNQQPFELEFESASEEKYSNDNWLNGASESDDSEIYPYTNSLSQPLPDALNWCRVYKVNWTYINENPR